MVERSEDKVKTIIDEIIAQLKEVPGLKKFHMQWTFTTSNTTVGLTLHRSMSL